MRRNYFMIRLLVAVSLSPLAVMSCSNGNGPATETETEGRQEGRWSHQDWPTGHYRVVENWPKPLPDTRHSHDGWTWGSFGGVYAENPGPDLDRHARRAASSEGGGALDPVRGAHPLAGKLQRQYRRPVRDL